MSGIDEQRRTSFGAVAAAYDLARPSYPAPVVDAVVGYAQARPGAPALEVGAGTGKATGLFAARGLSIDAIEPSAEMAAVAAANAELGGVRFLIDRFEDAAVAPRSYQLVFSGQAWHWVEPLLGERLAEAALVPGGALACFWNRVDWGRCALGEELSAAYGALPTAPAGLMTPSLGAIAFAEHWQERIDHVDGLTAPESRTFEWTETYSTAQYIALLGTHSDHVGLDEASRIRLYGAVATVLDEAGGQLELVYSTELCLARASE